MKRKKNLYIQWLLLSRNYICFAIFDPNFQTRQDFLAVKLAEYFVSCELGSAAQSQTEGSVKRETITFVYLVYCE